MSTSRPILFSAPMVRAILAGNKTQTRRIVKPQPMLNRPGGILRAAHIEGDFRWPSPKTSSVQRISNSIAKPNGPDGWVDDHNPYGKPNDQLWVRETLVRNTALFPAPVITYGADNKKCTDPSAIDNLDGWSLWRFNRPSVPSIHMPRWASRINLAVLEVRLERLQVITEADAIAEGLTRISKDNGTTWKWGIPDRDGLPGTDDDGWPWHEWCATPVEAYRKLWESINGPGSWAANPWAWVITFKRA